MFVRVTDELAASAPTSRTPARLAQVRVVGRAVAHGRARALDEVLGDHRALIVPRAPAARRTPSWPNSGPSAIGFGSGLPAGVGPPQSPSTLVSQQSWRPTICEVEIAPRRSRPEAVTGVRSLMPPSIRTPTRLYSSMRVLEIVSVRGPAPIGAVCRGGHLRDAVAEVLGAVAAGHRVRGGGLGGDDVGDAAAAQRALRVEEDDAGLGRHAVAVEGDAGDVDRDRHGRGADGGDDVARRVADVLLGAGRVVVLVVGDHAVVAVVADGGDRHEVGARALERDRLLDLQRARVRGPLPSA